MKGQDSENIPFVGSKPGNESAWKERGQINIILMTPTSPWTWAVGFGQHAACLKKALCSWAREKSRAWGEKVIQKEERGNELAEKK